MSTRKPRTFSQKLAWKLRRYRFVRPKWLLELFLQNFASRKTRVGFGHVHTKESTLTNRKFHIDPIVSWINRKSERYVCDIFFPGDELSKFDIVLFLKHFEWLGEEEVIELKRQGIKLLFNISDNPGGCEIDYRNAPHYMEAMDRVLTLSPIEDTIIPQYKDKLELVVTPIVDTRCKTTYEGGDPLTIYWEGFADNLYTIEPLIRIVRKIAEESQAKIRFILNTNTDGNSDEVVQYHRWNIHTWKDKMIASDIAVTIKPSADLYQQKKPPTKIISYMSAGLPIVCTPSASDRTVIEHGKTGFFAETEQEWAEYLSRLIADAGLRKKIGTAARKSVTAKCSVEQVGKRYTEIFDSLTRVPTEAPE